MIDRERLISEKQNNKASEAMLRRDIYKFIKPSLDAFRPFGLITRACQGSKDPPTTLTLTIKSNLTQSKRLTCRLLLNQFRFDATANRSSRDQN